MQGNHRFDLTPLFNSDQKIMIKWRKVISEQPNNAGESATKHFCLGYSHRLEFCCLEIISEDFPVNILEVMSTFVLFLYNHTSY